MGGSGLALGFGVVPCKSVHRACGGSKDVLAHICIQNDAMSTPAGYSSRFLAWAYAVASPLYDLIVW